MRNAYKILVRKLKVRDHAGDPGIDETLILKSKSRETGVRV
jgi:hypothetical protein